MRRVQSARPPNNYNRDRKPAGPRDDGEPIDALKFVHVIKCPKRDLALLKCLDNSKVPRFGAEIMEDGREVGTVEDVLGPVSDHFIVMKPMVGVQLGQLEIGRVFKLGTNALLGIERFLPQQPVKKVKEPQNKQEGQRGKFGKPGFNPRGGPRTDNFRRDGPREGGRDQWKDRSREQGGGRFSK